jgi:hypothetical protein
MAAIVQIAGQENAELAGGKIHAVATDEGDHGIPQDANELVGRKLRCHFIYPFWDKGPKRTHIRLFNFVCSISSIQCGV